jgi:hypothetical protein
MSLKQMALRHAGTCRVCGVELAAKTTAIYDFTAKNVLCLGCAGHDSSEVHEPLTRRGQDRRVGDRRRTTA